MDRKDIIKLAQEANIGTYINLDSHLVGNHLERFAALVAAAEREKVAAWMIERSYATGHGDTTEDLLKELEWQVAERERERIIAANAPEIEKINAHIKALEDAVTNEREACAQLLDDMAARDKLSNYYAVAAKAIRARGQE